MKPEVQIASSALFWLIVLGLSFVLSVFLVPIIVRLNKLFNCYDVPNERKIHQKKTATMGGMAIIGSLLLMYAITGKYNLSGYFWISLLLLTVVGIYDDIYGLRWHKKLIFQLLASVLFVSTGFNYSLLFDHTIFSFVPTLLQPVIIAIFIVLYINAFNLIDGMDGLAGGLATINFMIFGLFNFHFGNYSLAWLCFAITGALLGFLVYNMHPAKIFMGDTGSMSLGFLLVMVSFYTFQYHYHIPQVNTNEKVMFLWVIAGILALPFADAIRVFITRLWNKQLPYMPAKDHIHHILHRSGLSQRDTVLLLYGINIMFALTGIIIYLNKPISVIVSVLLLKM
ncbi:MAG: undecaprenyl/decaprenyl-phosphate alpha-N-acetylglucosaminyl 1-phosphate transferase [Bacteroidales bacterium]|nr:undecaprenyl/decaprenyl-phosphate alpha-N-acetylglucosaminyl 1-phosphate transferase [Bacteroidales bacterium]